MLETEQNLDLWWFCGILIWSQRCRLSDAGCFRNTLADNAAGHFFYCKSVTKLFIRFSRVWTFKKSLRQPARVWIALPTWICFFLFLRKLRYEYLHICKQSKLNSYKLKRWNCVFLLKHFVERFSCFSWVRARWFISPITHIRGMCKHMVSDIFPLTLFFTFWLCMRAPRFFKQKETTDRYILVFYLFVKVRRIEIKTESVFHAFPKSVSAIFPILLTVLIKLMKFYCLGSTDVAHLHNKHPEYNSARRKRRFNRYK